MAPTFSDSLYSLILIFSISIPLKMATAIQRVQRLAGSNSLYSCYLKDDTVPLPNDLMINIWNRHDRRLSCVV